MTYAHTECYIRTIVMDNIVYVHVVINIYVFAKSTLMLCLDLTKLEGQKKFGK